MQVIFPLCRTFTKYDDIAGELTPTRSFSFTLFALCCTLLWGEFSSCYSLVWCFGISIVFVQSKLLGIVSSLTEGSDLNICFSSQGDITSMLTEEQTIKEETLGVEKKKRFSGIFLFFPGLMKVTNIKSDIWPVGNKATLLIHRNLFHANLKRNFMFLALLLVTKHETKK